MMLKKLHLLTGSLFLVVFLGTGVYMLVGFPDLYKDREEIRMMYRATHIYILFGAFVNLLVGYSICTFKNWLAKVQLIASLLLFISPMIIFVGYIIEPPTYQINRPISYWGIMFIFIGVVLVSILNLPWAKKYMT